jgi:hypothetical protein
MQKTKEFNLIEFITAWEKNPSGMDIFEESAGFQYLIDQGLVWKLQGTYGRRACQLIDAGYCHECEGK